MPQESDQRMPDLISGSISEKGHRSLASVSANRGDAALGGNRAAVAALAGCAALPQCRHRLPDQAATAATGHGTMGLPWPG